MNGRTLLPWLLLGACIPGITGCKAPETHKAEADRQVYDIVERRRAELDAFDPFTIDPAADTLRKRLLNGEQLEPVDLQDALVIAAENSRAYSDQREALFITALNLTLQQWNFGVQESANASLDTTGSDTNAETRTGTAAFSISKLFTTGMQLVAAVALDTVRLIGNDNNTSSTWQEITRATLSITQPLLRGFGEEIVREPLTQAERNVLYEVRDYERFRRTFAFTVASQYFGVLQGMDVVVNEKENYRGLQALRERNESFAEAGRLDSIDVDQARQDELGARNRLIIAESGLETDYDDFKFLLGLPIESALPLDPGEYLSLDTWDFLELDPPEEIVVGLALEYRLDFLNAVEEVEDAERRVYIAEDALRNGLDFQFSSDYQSDRGDAWDFDSKNLDWQVALQFDLAIDRLPERNAYRATLVQLQQVTRDAEELSDSIIADLRAQLRTLRTARESYKIQQQAVELAARRVESTELQLEAGRSDTRDVLESQEALVNARNALTSALVSYILSGLALYRDMELLEVTAEGVTVDTAPILAALDPANAATDDQEDDVP